MPDPLTLADLRRARGFETQAALAKSSGVSLATIKSIESGAHRNPRLQTCRAIADALSVELVEVERAVAPAPARRRSKLKRSA